MCFNSLSIEQLKRFRKGKQYVSGFSISNVSDAELNATGKKNGFQNQMSLSSDSKSIMDDPR